MKKFLLALTLVFLLASPAVADAPFKLVVNDKPIDKPIVMIDNTAYVPIRAVADAFNATTDWNYTTKTISIKTKAIDPKAIKRPEIKGDAEFVSKITAALDLLEEKDFPHYWMVCMNTWGINQVTKKPPDVPEYSWALTSFGSTIVMPKLTGDPKRYVPEYLAGVLAHEACHSAQSNYDRDLNEREAYAHTIATYMAIDAPQWMRDEYVGQVK